MFFFFVHLMADWF